MYVDALKDYVGQELAIRIEISYDLKLKNHGIKT